MPTESEAMNILSFINEFHEKIFKKMVWLRLSDKTLLKVTSKPKKNQVHKNEL